MAKAKHTDEPEKGLVKAQAPAWLATAAQTDDSLEGLKNYRELPRIALIQGTSAQDSKDKYPLGTAILFPGETVLAEYGQPFTLVPVFQFTEFVHYADRRDQSQPKVVERTRDPLSKIARWSRMNNMREQEYPGGPKDKPFKYRFVEHIIIASVVWGEHPLRGEVVALNFSRGEFFTGTKFASACLMRRVPGSGASVDADGNPVHGSSMRAPLWSQVWEFRSNVRERNGNTWYGLDFDTPEEPWIEESDAPAMRELYESLRDDFKSGRIGANFTDAEDAEAEVVAPSAAASDM